MDLPVIDLDLFLAQPRDSEAVIQECKKAADSLIIYGGLVLHDSRVSEKDNSTFLDLMEDYFNQPQEELKKDERPELGYQVGVTLENTEKPKCAVDEPCLRIIEALEPSERPLDISAHSPDPKCHDFPGLNAPNVVPQVAFLKERWPVTMEQWGKSMKNAVADLADMVAIGLGIPAETFSQAGRFGPHLLAPTASDLVKYGKKDTILAGFHTDLNFLTIHGRSRYPGLNIWARNTGKRIPLEHISGGLIKAGFHEVVVNEQTLAVIEQRKETFPDRPLIRISSTFFWHLSSDYDLIPIPILNDEARQLRAEHIKSGKSDGDEVSYPPMKVGQQVRK
ncbi:hypothetical protein BDZ97DRAFT_1900355 [Flammula alnicola]|nr:hypothetical protein BDZ97DRAFT_1900355 [Flammula alnicola]